MSWNFIVKTKVFLHYSGLYTVLAFSVTQKQELRIVPTTLVSDVFPVAHFTYTVISAKYYDVLTRTKLQYLIFYLF